MAEDIKPETIKKTQDILGKFIKKPTLTEKLLKKPPFRFLHDICTSAMKESGFLVDVLNSPEDKIENIKDKEGKIEFLQKVIAAVEAANGIKLSVKPNKVVAGLEATKTNEFLQALGRALEKQLESKSSKHSQPTKTKPTKKTTKEVKQEPPDKKKNLSSKTSKKITENGMPEHNDEKKIDQPPTSPKKKNPSKKFEETEPVKLKESISKEKNLSNDVIEEKNADSKEERIHANKINISGAGESTDVPDVDFIMVNGANGQGDQNITTKEEVVPDSKLKKEHSGKHKNRRPSIQNVSDPTKVTDPPENNESVKLKSASEKPPNNNININKSETVLKEQNRASPIPPDQISYSKKDTNLIKENTLILRPRTGARPTTTRPASARPAAPRIRDKGEVVVEEITKPTIGKVDVIEDKSFNNEPEDENLISLETPNDILLEEPAPVSSPPTSTNEQEHGHLVEQILEVQRELEDVDRFPEQKISGKTEIEWEMNRKKESRNREIEKLRSNIQLLTRTANPLGKLLDFFQEDIDTVQRELESWKEKNSSLCLKIAHERSITDQLLEPLKIHLKELQQNIDEQLEQISIVKANIIKNNEKIYKLLVGM